MVVLTMTIGDTEWQVYVAIDYFDKATGLGGLDSIPAGTGMLFVYEAVQQVIVTTEPMLFNLDILFLDENLVVTEVHRDIPPGEQITATCQYFLEMNAGEAVNVQVGDQAQVSEPLPVDNNDTIWNPFPALEGMVLLVVVVGMMGAFSAIGEGS